MKKLTPILFLLAACGSTKNDPASPTPDSATGTPMEDSGMPTGDAGGDFLSCDIGSPLDPVFQTPTHVCREATWVGWDGQPAAKEMAMDTFRTACEKEKGTGLGLTTNPCPTTVPGCSCRGIGGPPIGRFQTVLAEYVYTENSSPMGFARLAGTYNLACSNYRATWACFEGAVFPDADGGEDASTGD